MTTLRIARLRTLPEFQTCVDIQRDTWNYSADELFPRRAFLLADKLGGYVLGAFDDDTLVAFNLAYPGHRDGRAYLHSQMLAVLPAYRNAGAGRALKLAQRDLALQQGFDRIEWTYDPLEIKNAFFNLHRLGAITRRYVRDFYGPSSSPLQGGLPTDRLYAEWWIGSDHVTRVLSGKHPAAPPEHSVTVPAEIYGWKSDSNPLAAEAQLRIREQLESAFARGFVATDYQRLPDGSGQYCLQPHSEEFPQ